MNSMNRLLARCDANADVRSMVFQNGPKEVAGSGLPRAVEDVLHQATGRWESIARPEKQKSLF